MRIKSTLLVLLAIFLSGTSFSQADVKDSVIFAPMIFANYSYQLPQGDLAKIFGGNSAIGGGVLFKTTSNWVIGAEGNYLFGGTVKNSDSILKGISTPDGFLIDENGFYGDVVFSERGFNVFGKFGKVFPITGPNSNSGIMGLAGVGYLQDKIRLHVIQSSLPSVEGDYRKGYDKLNGGLALSGSVGYFLMSNSRLLNFYVGLEFMQSWTKSKRDYDFATGKKDNKTYSTQFYGFNFKWMIPLFKRKAKDYYLY